MNIIKRAITVICTLSLLLSAAVIPASAASVTYDDVTEKLVFSADNQENPTDLFEDFKDAMPGDTLTQTLKLVNKNTNRMHVKVWIRSLGAEEGYEALLSKLTLSVNVKNSSPFFIGAADKPQAAGEWVELGTISVGGEIELELKLTIPVELGNEFQKAIGKLKWEFKSEEQPIETQKKLCPNCGGDTYDIITVKKDGIEFVVYRCSHCQHEEEMHCDVCGSRMHKVLVQGTDGKFYYYYECEHLEKHHTPVSPVTGDGFDVSFWASLLCVAFIGMTLSVLLLKRKDNQEDK